MPQRIPTHRPLAQRVAAASARRNYERRVDRQEDKDFYKSMAWRSLRLLYLSEHPLCEDCERIGRLTAAEQVHHRIERKADPDRALDWDNLQALCKSCHGRKRSACPS